MRTRLAVLFGFSSIAIPVSLVAQTAEEPAAHPCDAQAGPARPVCRAGYDAIVSIVPVGALAVSGGNPVLGTAAGGRGFGDILVTLRANVVKAVLPATTYDGSSDTVGVARTLPVLVPSLDVRFGLFRKALPVGTASVDFLGSINGVPMDITEHIRFGSDVRSVGGVALGFGYGLRIGMALTDPLPSASLNVGRHDLPTFTVGDLSAGSNFAYTVAVSAINVRLIGGKRFGGFEFAAGGGVDLIKGSYSVVFRDPTTQVISPRADSSVSTMRIVTTANGSFHLGGLARLSFEAGFQVGKDEKLPTIFEGNNTRSGRFFGAVGVGFKL